MIRRSVEILDTTLRDGAQAEGISFSVNDKFQVVETLAALGVRYIEAGNPGSNPKDREFYNRFRSNPPDMAGSRLAAFGSTRRKNSLAEEDANVRDLLEAGTPVIVIFGKVWDLEVRDILRCSLKENQAMIRDTIAYCCSQGREVIFDAEHYFEACAANRDYALSCLKAACEGGASVVCLCDTNGATMPETIGAMTAEAVSELPGVKVGIHCHNDAGLAVAGSIAAVLAGAGHVQGTLNGIGERCGNANLSTIIANLHIKYPFTCIPEDNLPRLTPLSRLMADIANLTLPNGEPYVGLSAFSHKGGMHVDGVKKNPITFEHIDPESVGNSRRFLLSEVSGRSAVLDIVRRVKPDIDRDAPEVGRVLQKMKEMEHLGYQYEGAEASLELLVCKELGIYTPFFSLEKLRIASEQPKSGAYSAYTYIKILVDGVGEATAAEGEGPVNAMDQALKRAMEVFYPELTHVRLTDFKVRVINADATASKVRTLIESTDGRQIWNTVGVSTDILEASWQALVDSLEYKLMRRQLEWEE
ncbi:MAG: citramalate synthase [Clostridiaceae bacterium]|jgi:2-isopropylmalate synthase|nr:citramalate synthase [Clostridiales bacterium]NLB44291.1 citramalate synthase [Clostridiaceae bacterium]